MGVTRTLARYVVESRPADIPPDVRREATRSLLNYLGCTIGGCRHETVDNALATIVALSPPPQAGVLGRTERIDTLHAALVNGMCSHVLDFDDTHLATLFHPTGPVASALLALAERDSREQPLSGADFLHALVLGIEIECRIAGAICFEHNADWYITGTIGVIGAAVAAGKILGLGERQMLHAIGIACSQSAGTREMVGTMCKSFIIGRSGQNGLFAALLARNGFTSSDTSIEGKHGLARVFAREPRLDVITAGLGTRFEAALNTYKPFACGVVIHPVLDACIQLRDQYQIAPKEIEAVVLHAYPRALELTGVTAPKTGLEGKSSFYHAAAVALIDGAAGERQFSDQRVNDPTVIALRNKVSATADASLTEVQARVRVTLKSGEALEKHIEQVVGSATRPMSDAQLEAKVRCLAEENLSVAQVDRVIETCWRVSTLEDAGEIVRATLPS